MAMLGKRFQRTISMSQIGPPGSNLHAEKAQAAHPSPTPPSAADHPAPKLPLILHDSTQKINEQHLLQAAANQWEALKARQQDDHHLLHHNHNHNHHHHNHHHHLHIVHQQTAASNPIWEALKGSIGSGPQQDDMKTSKQHEHLQPPASANQWEILKNAEAMMLVMMQQSSSHESSAHSSVDKEDDTQVMSSSPNDLHMHLGLWPDFPASPSTSPSSISREHFLDACFLCKRRLRQERDIFIYRGDTAFCSEECRHRQILSDETHSLRASRKVGATLGTITP